MTLIKTILVPHDFSEYADAALGLAVDLGFSLDADLHLLHVVQPPAYAYSGELYGGGPIHNLSDPTDLHRTAQARLREVASRMTSLGWLRPMDARVVEGTRICDVIDDEAERVRADLIVMGTHGRAGLAHLIRGSVAEATLRQAPCPVLTVPMNRAHFAHAHSETRRSSHVPSGVV